MLYPYRIPFAEGEYKQIVRCCEDTGLTMAGFVRMNIIRAKKEYQQSNQNGLYMCLDKIFGERFYINVRLNEELHDFVQQLSNSSSIAECQILRCLLVKEIGKKGE